MRADDTFEVKVSASNATGCLEGTSKTVVNVLLVHRIWVLGYL